MRWAHLGVLVAQGLRESRVSVAWMCLSMFVVVYLGGCVLPPLQGAVSQLAHQVPLVDNLVRASLGSVTHEQLTMRVLLGLLWAHPFVLALAWAPALVLCTRFPAGEVERGTIDLLLSWPVSRLEIAAAELILWVGTSLAVHVAAFAAWWLAVRPELAGVLPDLASTALVLGCLWVTSLAVGGFASLVSAWSDQRGRAQGIVFSLLFASYLAGVLAPLWPPAAPLRALSILELYQPGTMLATGQVPLQDVRTLLLVAVLCEVAALHRIATRPLATT